MAARSGKEFLERLSASHPTVYVQGEELTGGIADHPAFRNVVRSYAELFDMQAPGQLDEVPAGVDLAGRRKQGNRQTNHRPFELPESCSGDLDLPAIPHPNDQDHELTVHDLVDDGGATAANAAKRNTRAAELPRFRSVVLVVTWTPSAGLPPV